MSRFWTALILTVSVLVCVPILLPGGELYMDNAPHLLEVQSAASQILPIDHWYTGWTDQAEMGFAVGQINAPLAWTPLAFAVSLGAPLVGSYLFSIVLANVLFSLGFLRAARKLLGNETAAGWAALLAAVAPTDLWGISGAAGGMWPFRMAAGLFFWGVVAEWGLAGRALWLGALVLMHTYVGVVGFGWASVGILLALWQRDRLTAARFLGAILLGAGLAAFFVLPTLEPGMLPFTKETVSKLLWRPLSMIAFCLGSPDMLEALLNDWPGMLGGPASLVSGAMMVGGLLGGLRAHGWNRPRWSGSGLHLLIALGGLAFLVMTVVPTFALAALGPNPWRYLAFVRQGLYLWAGLGLARWAPSWKGWIMGTFLVGATLWIGWVITPSTLKPETGDVVSALQQTWEDLAATRPKGWVYHDDPAQDPNGPPSLYDSHLGALLPVFHGLPEVGSWYGVTPIWTYKKTNAQGNKVFATAVGRLQGLGFDAKLDRYGIGAVITASPQFQDFADHFPRLHRVSVHPPFAAYTVDDPKLALATITGGTATELERGRGLYRADVTTIPGSPITFRIGWHPWWKATLNGEPIPLAVDEDSGLMVGTLPGNGTLTVHWEDQGQPGRWISLGSLGVLLLLFLRPRPQATFFQTPDRPAEL